jgi:hypothetical protein
MATQGGNARRNPRRPHDEGKRAIDKQGSQQERSSPQEDGIMQFVDLDLGKLLLEPVEGDAARGFKMTILVSRGDDRFDPRPYELPTWAGLIIKAIIAENTELRTRLSRLESKPLKAKPAKREVA